MPIFVTGFILGVCVVGAVGVCVVVVVSVLVVGAMGFGKGCGVGTFIGLGLSFAFLTTVCFDCFGDMFLHLGAYVAIPGSQAWSEFGLGRNANSQPNPIYFDPVQAISSF